MSRLWSLVAVILIALLIMPFIVDFYAGMMPAIEEHGTVPEIAMWKLMPVLILFCLFIVSIANLARPRKSPK